MKLFSLFKKKESKKNKFLLEEYEKGRVLQVGNNIDNKEFLREK